MSVQQTRIIWLDNIELSLGIRRSGAHGAQIYNVYRSWEDVMNLFNLMS